MSRFRFPTDSQSRDYLELIVEAMKELFGISDEEAVGRINRMWGAIEFVGPDDAIYHEGPDYWAKTIYYDESSFWWMDPPPTNLKPRPYP
jgi:hypothetical protein